MNVYLISFSGPIGHKMCSTIQQDVYGDWDKWSTPLRAVLSQEPSYANKYVCAVDAAFGPHQYKMHDCTTNEWFYTHDEPTFTLADGTINNYFYATDETILTRPVLMMRPRFFKFPYPSTCHLLPNLIDSEYRSNSGPYTCPFCLTVFMKRCGCNRMTCMNCGISFCLECGLFLSEEKKYVYEHLCSAHGSAYERNNKVTFNLTYRDYKITAKVQIAGPFNNWKPQLMHRSPEFKLPTVGIAMPSVQYEYVVPFDEYGKAIYKIMIDGKWIIDENALTIKDNEGNVNNVIYQEKTQ